MRITIYGAGYVGLVTSVCFAQLGHHVCCVDVDLSKIETLNAGHAPIFEAGLEALLQENLQAQRLFFTSDIATAAQFSEIQMIAVGTPAHSDGSADLQYVDAVATQIGMHMSSYRCVVNKSTVPVGTSEPGMSLLPLSPNESNEAGGPVATADGAQVGIGGEQVMQHQSIAFPVYAVTALDMVGKAHIVRKILQAGVMELVCAN